MYTVKTSTLQITENKTIRPSSYGGWLAVNIGTGVATVDDIPLSQGDGLDYTKLSPDVIWDEPIIIVCEPGAKVILKRLLYKQI